MHSVVVWAMLAEVTEALVFFGYVLPRLESRLRSRWMAAVAVIAVWSLSASVYPILSTDCAIDLSFAGHRAASVLPVIATWTALYYARLAATSDEYPACAKKHEARAMARLRRRPPLHRF